MKKIVFLLSLMFCATVVWAQNTFDVPAGGWTLRCSIDGNVASVVGHMAGQGDLTIPATVPYHDHDYPVTSIGDNAFSYCSALTNIDIPSSVTSIGYSAFDNCGNLANVTFATSSSLASIGKMAFYNCTGLTSVTIPDRVTSIGDYAFSNCTGLTSVTIPNSVTSIGTSVFQYCYSLTSVTIPNSVTSIGYRAFRSCSGLTSVTIPNSVTSIGSNAFSDCTGLTSVNIPNSVTTIGDDAFANVRTVIYCGSATGSPWGANNAGCFHCDGDFIYDTTDTKTALVGYLGAGGDVTIPDTVTSIGKYAFYKCTGLTSITIPSSVTSIGDRAFLSSGLRSVTFEGTSRLNSIGEDAFSGCGFSSITIPNSVTSIGNSAFSNCSGLTSVTIGSSVTSIGASAFHTCENLANVTFAPPSSLNSIGNKAFCNCSGLTSITIPDSVTTIGDRAFASSGLESVTFAPPSSLTSIGNEAFKGCHNLTRITIPNSVAEIGQGAFYGCDQLDTVTFETPSRLTSIKDVTFEGCYSLRSINIPDSVTSIGSCAFYPGPNPPSPSALESIDIPSSVTSIGDSAFLNCINLATVTFDGTSRLTSIGENAFSGCSALDSIAIPDSVESIGKRAFMWCFNLATVTFKTPSRLTSIGEGAFDNCNLTSITIPSSVTSIESDAFFVSGLESVTFEAPSSLNSIGESAFDGCEFSNITIPKSVTEIGRAAFHGCDQLATVTFETPSRLTRIKDATFEGCYSLRSINIPDSVTSIGSHAFYQDPDPMDPPALASIVIPSSVESIGSNAFYGCSNLKTVFNYSSRLEINAGSDFNGATPDRVITGNDTAMTSVGRNALVQVSADITTIPQDHLPVNYIAMVGSEWKANDIVLTDCQDTFNAPVGFTADSVTYTRRLTDGNRSTLCLPFTTTIPDDLEVYEFTDFDGYTIYFTEYTGDIEAYKPYLVGKGISKSTTDFTFTQTDAVFPATSTAMASAPVTDNYMTFQGVMERTAMTSTNNYGYKDGYFVRSGGSAHVNPFRCYFTWNNAPQGAPQHLDIDTDGGEVGIEQPAADDAAQNGHIRYSNDVYDLMGRMVRKEASDLRGLPKGIYIWRGKKVMAF